VCGCPMWGMWACGCPTCPSGACDTYGAIWGIATHVGISGTNCMRPTPSVQPHQFAPRMRCSIVWTNRVHSIFFDWCVCVCVCALVRAARVRAARVRAARVRDARVRAARVWGRVGRVGRGLAMRRLGWGTQTPPLPCFALLALVFSPSSPEQAGEMESEANEHKSEGNELKTDCDNWQPPLPYTSLPLPCAHAHTHAHTHCSFLDAGVLARGLSVYARARVYVLRSGLDFHSMQTK